MNLGKTKKSLLLQCILLLITGVMLSFMVVTALAAWDPVVGPKKIFQLGDGHYTNHSTLSYNGSSVVTSTTHITCTSATLPAGHLGAVADIYKEISTDKYSLYSAGSWAYSPSASASFANATNTIKNTPKGNYMCKGQTATYYSGTYRRQDTYSTPNLSVIP